MKTRRLILSIVLAVFTASQLVSLASAEPNPNNSTENPAILAAKVSLDTSQLTEAQLAAAAKVLNLTVDQLRGSLAEGKTLEELAEIAGVDVNLVYTAIRRAKATQTTALYSGSLNEAQRAAVAKLLNLSSAELYGSLLEGKTLEELVKAAGVKNWQVNEAIRTASATPIPPISTNTLNDAQRAAVAKVLHISAAELYGSLLEGKTLDELAKAAGVENWQINEAIRTAKTVSTPAISTNTLTESQLYAVAKVLNLTAEQLRGSLLEGKTLAELAASAGVANWKVNAAIRNAPYRRGISVAETALSDSQLKAVAVLLGVNVTTLQNSIREGLTLAQLAKNKGIDVQLLYDAINQN